MNAEEAVSMRDTIYGILSPHQGWMANKESPMSFADRELILPSIANEMRQALELPESELKAIMCTLSLSANIVPYAMPIIWDIERFSEASADYNSYFDKLPTPIEEPQLWLYFPQRTAMQGDAGFRINCPVAHFATLLTPVQNENHVPLGILGVHFFHRLNPQKLHFKRKGEHLADDAVVGIPIVRTFFQDLNEMCDSYYAGFEAARAYLNSEADWEPMLLPVSHAGRGKSTHSGTPLSSSPFCIQVLRRLPESAWHRSEAAEAIAPRSYHCRFEVKEHMRHLAQPRKKDGATVVPVRKHIKGPHDKPFKTIQERIVRVKR